MYTGIFFSIEALFYLGLLLLVYFKKKVFKSRENKIYSILVIVTFIELLTEIILDIVGPLYQAIPKISYSVAKIYCIFIILWNCLLCTYVFLVALKMKNKERYSSSTKTLLISFGIALSLASALLPINFYYSGKIAYTYGPSVNVVYISAIVYSLIGVFCLLWNAKEWKDKRFIPVIILVTLGSLCSYIQYMNPGLLLATAVHSFITFIMYFTIENPDVKMIEEYHKAKEIADNANEDKTMFLYNMTNDIRAITKDINNDANNAILELDSKKIDKDYMSECLRGIKENTARFTTMTNEILDVSSIDNANIKVYDEKYSIKLLLRRLVTLYNDKCKEKNLTFRSDIDSTLPEYLYGDSLGLKNVLTSILDNSVKYTSNGYVELNVSTIIKNNIVRLIITIEDSGIGISPDKLDTIFYKNREEIDGSNIKNNLYTAKKLITLMGGTIIASSNYNEGTTMKIVLDQKLGEQDDEKLTKYENTYDKKRILLVDDNISTNKIISKLLKDTNIELDYVGLGKEALDKIRSKEKYDLILLDEVMDPLDGKTVMKKFKDIRDFNTKVILLTRNNEYEYNEEYLKYGFAGYLLKPINKDKLLEIIDKYL
jgi:CheY-like chemotaxis protein